jgi:hypothetical protein
MLHERDAGLEREVNGGTRIIIGGGRKQNVENCTITTFVT